MPGSSRLAAPLKAVLGPTNTGKTHLAVERMLAHRTGMIGLPLRLLAREVYDRVVKAKGASAAALITGEEKIGADDARYIVATVEAMPLDRAVDFLAIDEIQLAADPDRGHVFTDRMLHARGTGETMLLGAETMRAILRRLLPEAEVTRRERLSTLSYAGARKLAKLPKRSAIVAFSAEEVYAIAELIRRHRGGAAVVMGALSPRTRNAQVALYQSGEVDFLVATDAIGMGLNMDVDHVAFASAAKFDGRRNRVLRPDEVAQIAGRAGRFQRDGLFGETGECPPFDEETIARVEAHEFEAIDAVEWRSRALDFSSAAALAASLERPPDRPGLMRTRRALDEETLRRLPLLSDIADKAQTPAAVRRLWEACQLPDFRKAPIDEHAALVAKIAEHLLREGRIPDAWVERELRALDRPEGDLDQLQARLAQIRTWSYIANRADWLKDPGAWRVAARALEDRISDALHNLLTQRFIDRRTSALLKGLRREEALRAGVAADGAVSVEGHYVGRLEGLAFVPDPAAFGLEARAVKNAALRALRPEVLERLARIASAPPDAFELSPAGELWGLGARLARIAPGETLAPRLALIGAEDAPAPRKAAALAAMEAALASWIAAELAPLLRLREAWRSRALPLSARGLAFRLVEAGGALARPDAPEAAGLDEEGRAALRALGVRLGAGAIYAPALLRPPALALHAILRSASLGLPLPVPPAMQGPVMQDRRTPPELLASAGALRLHGFVVAILRAERALAALRRAGGALPDAVLAARLGVPGSALVPLMRALGFRRGEKAGKPVWRPRRPPPPAGAQAAASPFAALAAVRDEAL